MGQLRTFLWPTQDIPEVRLVSAKARVAPLRQSTISRLELINGSPHLLKTRRDRLRRIQSKPETVQFWSDSKIVLHWLRSDSTCLKAFVGVRIADI